LKQVAKRLKPSKLAVVMTGELADCFPDKKSGVQYIKKAVETAFTKTQIKYANIKGELTDGDDALFLAAANWCASAKFLADEFKNCIFADMGSTTTDIIPIINGTPTAHTTDFMRFLYSELVYTGVLRTNTAALTNYLYIKGRKCTFASEYFANTADVHLILGHITEDEYTCETADGAGADLLSAKRRLARTLCADLTEITDEEIRDIAGQYYHAQLDHIKEALENTAQKHELNHVIACGIGEFAIKKAALRAGLKTTLLSEIYGKKISSVFPAYAAAKLMEKI
jgi:hypothetical protein